MRSSLSIECDDPRRTMLLHRLAEEALGCRNIAVHSTGSLPFDPVCPLLDIGRSTGPSLRYRSHHSAMTYLLAESTDSSTSRTQAQRCTQRKIFVCVTQIS